MAIEGSDILTVALLAEGGPMDEDSPRVLPELIEVALHAVCLWTVLEEDGVAHGDVAPSNVFVSQRGSVRLIDFDNFDLNDGSAPPPTMIGQPMMLAPELRNGSATPNRLSDRFAWGVLLSWLLLGRHPADGLARNPAERDAALACGHWPERDRLYDPNGLRITALGTGLGDLFDRAFSLLSADRPSADDWRRALMQALAQTVIHRCGAAFVHDGALVHCPDCRASLPTPAPAPALRPAQGLLTLTIANMATRETAEFTLNDGETLILGRANLPGGTTRVSGQHLQIRRFADRLHLKHLGRNPTILIAGNRRLSETWIRLDHLHSAPVKLTIADTSVEISAS